MQKNTLKLVGLLTAFFAIVNWQSCTKNDSWSNLSFDSNDKLIQDVRRKFEDVVNADRASIYSTLGVYGKKHLELQWEKACIHAGGIEVPFAIDYLIPLPVKGGNGAGLRSRGRKRLFIPTSFIKKEGEELFFVSYIPNAQFQGRIWTVNLANLNFVKFSGDLIIEPFNFSDKLYLYEVSKGKTTNSYSGMKKDRSSMNRSSLRSDCLQWYEFCEDNTDTRTTTETGVVNASGCTMICLQSNSYTYCSSGSLPPFCITESGQSGTPGSYAPSMNLTPTTTTTTTTTNNSSGTSVWGIP